MRLKSFKVMYDFCMWNSWCSRIEIRENENEKVNESLTDNFFIDFDVISSVAIKRCEHFNDTDSNIDVDVAKKIENFSETNETNEQTTVDFFAILHANSSARIWKSKFLTNFRAWCWRICSWNLLLKLKIWLQRRHVIVLFVDFDLREANDVFLISHTKLTALIERRKSLTSWSITFSTSVCIWNSWSINSTCFWIFCSRWCAWRMNCCSNLWRNASWHEEDSR